MECDKPQCLAARVVMRLRKTAQREDGVVLRVYSCPRCRRKMQSLEWPENLLRRRFELLRKEVEHERQRLRKKVGGMAMDKCLDVLKAAQIDLERSREEVRRYLDCGEVMPEYDVGELGAYSPTNVL